MKRLLVSIVAGLCIAAPAASSQDSITEVCADWALFAKMQMHLRQGGTPITDAAKAAKAAHDAAGSSDEDREVSKKIILMAYNRPLELTDRAAEVAEIQFGEDFFAHCVAAGSD